MPDIQYEMDKIKEEYLKNNLQLFLMIDHLNELKNIMNFWTNSNDEQKKTFNRLVDCEWADF